MSVSETVRLVFKGVDEASGTMKNISGGFGRLEAGISSVVSPLAKVADGVLKADAALLTLAAGGLAIAYKRSVDFSLASTKLYKILGDESDRIKDAEQAAIGLSDKYGILSEQALGSMEEFRRAGFALDEAMGLAEQSAILVRAAAEAELEAADASAAIISVLKGFNAEAKEAGRLTDVLNYVANNYATSVKELSEGMAQLSPIAKSAGLSFEETAGILTPVIEVFRSGSEASQALKMGLLSLTDTTKGRVVKALEELGVSQIDANGKLRQGKDVLYDVQKAFQGLSATEQNYYAQQLAGIRQAARMGIVFSQMEKTAAVTKTALESAGSAVRETNLILEESKSQIERFIAGLDNLAIAVGAQFEDAVTATVRGGADIANALRRSVDASAFDGFFDLLKSFSDDLGDTLTGIAEALPEALGMVDFSGLIDNLSEVRDNVSGLFGDLDLGTPEDLADAIQFAVDSIDSLVDVTQGMIDKFKVVFDAVVDGIDKFNKLDEGSKEAAGGILGNAKIIAEAGVKIGGAFVLISELGGDFVSVVKSVVGAGNKLVGTFQAIGGAVSNTLNSTVSGVLQIGEGVIGIVPGLDGAADAIGEFRNDYIDAAADIAKDQMFTGVNKVLGKTEKEAKKAGSAFERAVEKMKKFGEAAKSVSEESVDVNVEVSGAEAAEATITALGGDQDVVYYTTFDGTEIRATNESMLAFVDGYWQENPVQMHFTPDDWEVVKNNPKFKLLQDRVQEASKIHSEVQINEASVEKAVKEVEKVAEPLENDLQVKLDIAHLETQTDRAITKMKTDADKMESLLQFEATLKTAQMEAATERMKTSFNSLNESIASTGNTLSNLVGSLSGFEGTMSDKWKVLDAINQEMRLREKAFELQEKMLTAQTNYYKTLESRLKSGDPWIEVKSDGLEQYLEEFMWAILKRVQTRAIQNAEEFLLGMPTV